jgi:hypothetical protein
MGTHSHVRLIGSNQHCWDEMDSFVVIIIQYLEDSSASIYFELYYLCVFSINPN